MESHNMYSFFVGGCLVSCTMTWSFIYSTNIIVLLLGTILEAERRVRRLL